MKRFLITGTGRCGTWWMSQVLCRLGIRCGHEQVWDRAGFHGWGAFDGESSCLAARWAEPGDVEAVLHLVRHPVDYANSVSKFALGNRRRNVDAWMVEAYGKSARELPSLWLEVNRRVEEKFSGKVPYLRCRIEGFGERELRAFFSMTDAVVPPGIWDVDEAMEAPRRKKSDQAPEKLYTAADFQDVAILEKAREYGYTDLDIEASQG